MTAEEEIKLAEKYGFKPEKDRARGGKWSKFQKGDIHIWMCSKGWARAVVVNGYFTGHIYGDLEGVLKIENHL